LNLCKPENPFNSQKRDRLLRPMYPRSDLSATTFFLNALVHLTVPLIC